LKKIRKTAEVFKFGQMVQDMMDSGKMVWQTAMDVLCTLKEMSMRASGQKIKLMDMVFILILMEVDMRDSGSKINNMDTE
jgi:hypothetical protein